MQQRSLVAPLIRTQVVLEVAPVLVEVSGVAMDREVAVVVEVRHRHVKGVACNINCPGGKQHNKLFQTNKYVTVSFCVWSCHSHSKPPCMLILHNTVHSLFSQSIFYSKDYYLLYFQQTVNKSYSFSHHFWTPFGEVNY